MSVLAAFDKFLLSFRNQNITSFKNTIKNLLQRHFKKSEFLGQGAQNVCAVEKGDTVLNSMNALSNLH